MGPALQRTVEETLRCVGGTDLCLR